MTTKTDCDWDTGTVYTGPRTCGKPAKFAAVEPGSGYPNRRVCGVHAGSARRLGYAVTPIGNED